MNTQKLDEVSRGMSLERVVYSDGMILTAEDFEAERTYHLARSRMLNRAVFGCGIACGLELEPYLCGEDTATHSICVKPGTAIDCPGDPLQLCRAVKLDLDPDPCRKPPANVCIAIRRLETAAPSRDDCCRPPDPYAEEPRHWQREFVLVRAFAADALPHGICARPGAPTNGTDPHDPPTDHGHTAAGREKHDPCTCLTECDSCDACGDGWILLGCVTLHAPDPANGRGERAEHWWFEQPDIDRSGVKYIKPIACLCPDLGRPKPERTDDHPPPSPPVVPAPDATGHQPPPSDQPPVVG